MPSQLSVRRRKSPGADTHIEALARQFSGSLPHRRPAAGSAHEAVERLVKACWSP